VATRQPGAPVRRITVDRGKVDPTRWPYTLAVIRQVVAHGLELAPGLTVIVGANGSGKSTLIEALGAAWGRRITAFRDDWLQQAVAAPSAEDSDLDRALRLAYTPGGPTGGLVFRAERLHLQMKHFVEPGRWQERIDGHPLERSHGEGFLSVLAGMTAEPGLYVLDEPEAALSFDSTLALVAILTDMLAAGSQVVMATHSPILAAYPSARLLQCSATGIDQISYDDSDLASSWRSFLAAPASYLRHLT
jgi:predicted ATPase